MASVLIATVPIHGHVTPLLPVARHLVARGDRVRFLTGARFSGAVAATGAHHVPLPADAEFDDQMDLAETYPERVGLSGAKAIAFDIEHVFVRPGRAQHDAVMSLHAQEPADVLLVDPAFVGAGFVVGHPRESRPPVLVCGVVPLTIASRDTAPYGMGLTPLGGPVGRARNALLGTFAARTVFPASQRLADDIHRTVLGRPIPYPILDWPRHAEALAQFTVPEFEYPRSDAPKTLHFVGPIAATGSQAPLPSWWHEVDGSTAGRPRHPGNDRQPRPPTGHRPRPRGSRRRGRAGRRLHRRPRRSTPSSPCRRTRAPPSTSPTTTSCPAPTST